MNEPKTPQESIQFWRDHALWLENELATATIMLEKSEQRVERLRLAWDDLAMRAAESTRSRRIDAEEAAAKHLMPGDLAKKLHGDRARLNFTNDES